MRHIKVTCPNCKKNIYCTRESEHVTCSECHCIMTIVKEVPLRPGTYEHKFTASIAIKNEDDNKNKSNKTQKKLGGYQKFDPFKDLSEQAEIQSYAILNYIKYFMYLMIVVSIASAVFLVLIFCKVKLQITKEKIARIIDILEWIIIFPICIA